MYKKLYDHRLCEACFTDADFLIMNTQKLRLLAQDMHTKERTKSRMGTMGKEGTQ